MSRVQVPCHIKGAVALQVGDVRTVQGRPGVLVIDVTFPTAGPFELQEITFKNYYTAFLSIRVRQVGSPNQSSNKWITCLRDYCLMPNPHNEEGAQDYVSLYKHQNVGIDNVTWETLAKDCAAWHTPIKEGAGLYEQNRIAAAQKNMLCDMDKVLELRLILRQPSPLWLNFTLEELQFFQHGPQSPSSAFTKWLSHPAPYEQPALLLQQALPDPDKVSSEVQQMWMLTEMIRANRTTARIGRFDVDGCYDLNLLSYT